MKKTRDRRHVSLDIEHMRRLHQEAIEQLELMRTALEAAEQAIGTMRDTLDEMAMNHWAEYLDTVHMISMHDEAMATVINKYEINARETDTADQADQQIFGNHPLLMLLLRALTRRHRRFWDIYGLRGNPMSEYLIQSMIVEREHMAELISMIQNTL